MLKKSLSVFSGAVAMCCALSLITPVKAEASLSGGRYLTPSETVAVIGDSLDVTYFDGDENVTVAASYVGSDYARAVDSIYQSTDYFQTGLQTIVFRFFGNVVNNPQYIAVDFAPAFSLLNVDQVHTCIGISADNSSGISASVYQTPQWIWTMGGVSRTFEGRADYGMHYRAELTTSFAYGSNFDYVPVDWSHQGLTSAHSQRALFSYASPASDGFYYIVFGCPYITYDGSIDTVSGTTGTTSTGTGVNVNVDMRETNGLLSSIQNTLSGIGQSILNGIASIFVPDPDYIQTKVNAIYDKFAWWRSIVTTWNAFYDSFSALDFDSPPQYTIDYSDTTSAYGYSYGASARVLVLDWFLEYRDTVRIFLRGFIWLFFIWRVYCHIPNIIQGTGMDVQRTDDGSVSVAPRGKH